MVSHYVLVSSLVINTGWAQVALGFKQGFLHFCVVISDIAPFISWILCFVSDLLIIPPPPPPHSLVAVWNVPSVSYFTAAGTILRQFSQLPGLPAINYAIVRQTALFRVDRLRKKGPETGEFLADFVCIWFWTSGFDLCPALMYRPVFQF